MNLNLKFDLSWFFFEVELLVKVDIFCLFFEFLAEKFNNCICWVKFFIDFKPDHHIEVIRHFSLLIKLLFWAKFLPFIWIFNLDHDIAIFGLCVKKPQISGKPLMNTGSFFFVLNRYRKDLNMYIFTDFLFFLETFVVFLEIRGEIISYQSFEIICIFKV